MLLGELISTLSKCDPDAMASFGFERPHSHRGDYVELAFVPTHKPMRIGSMLAHARIAVGKTYEGWKGGEFQMDENSRVYLAERGACGDPITEAVLAAMLNPPFSAREEIYREVDRERYRQDKKWGGPKHDDEHSHKEWVGFLVQNASRCLNLDESFHDFRTCMVRVAALAVAAIESNDRQYPPPKFEKVDVLPKSPSSLIEQFRDCVEVEDLDTEEHKAEVAKELQRGLIENLKPSPRLLVDEFASLAWALQRLREEHGHAVRRGEGGAVDTSTVMARLQNAHEALASLRRALTTVTLVGDPDFVTALSSLLNRYSMENESNTPDYILARFLQDCLVAFNKTSRLRELWYGTPLGPPSKQ